MENTILGSTEKLPDDMFMPIHAFNYHFIKPLFVGITFSIYNKNYRPTLKITNVESK